MYSKSATPASRRVDPFFLREPGNGEFRDTKSAIPKLGMEPRSTVAPLALIRTKTWSLATLRLDWLVHRRVKECLPAHFGVRKDAESLNNLALRQVQTSGHATALEHRTPSVWI